MWFVNGIRHRVNGPAIEYATGLKVWYLNGIKQKEEIVKINPYIHLYSFVEQNTELCSICLLNLIDVITFFINLV